MKTRLVLLTVVLALCGSGLSEDKPQSPSQDCGYAVLVQKFDDLQKKDSGWRKPEALGPLILGSGGWILAIYMFASGRKSELRKQQLEQLFQSLRWFEGKTQQRSIGIAVIEANQRKFWKEMGEVWASVLTLQAKHILTKSDAHDETEQSNLERIFVLLKEKVNDRQRQDICETLKLDPNRRAGLDISDGFRNKWLNEFDCRLPAGRSFL